MDNKITKKRLNDHLEYDWFKYIIILIASIVLWVFVFGQINANRDHEEAQFFLSCYSSKDNDINARILGKMKTDMDKSVYGENVLRNLSIEKQNVLANEYTTMLSTHGSYSSDIIIVGKKYINGVAPVTLTDELLALILPEGFVPTYHEANGVKIAIRVDTLPGIKDLADFNLPQSEIDKEWKDDDPNKPDTEFYLMLNRNSVNLGKWGSAKTKDNNGQMLYATKLFLAEFMK